MGFDAAVEFQPDWMALGTPLSITDDGTRVFSYESLGDLARRKPLPDYRYFRTVLTSWDNTPRRRIGGAVLQGSTPEALRRLAPARDRNDLERRRSAAGLRQRLERVGRGRPPRARSDLGPSVSRRHTDSREPFHAVFARAPSRSMPLILGLPSASVSPSEMARHFFASPSRASLTRPSPSSNCCSWTTPPRTTARDLLSRSTTRELGTTGTRRGWVSPLIGIAVWRSRGATS